MRTRTRLLTATLLGAAVTLVADRAPAQEAPASVHVRVLSIASDGASLNELPTTSGRPQQTFEGAELEAPWIREELRKLPDTKFKFIGESTRSRVVALDKPHTFEQLPAGHWARVSLKRPGDTFTLKLEVTRKGPVEGEREKVVDAEVKVLNGGHCVVRCIGALDRRAPAGTPGRDLLLLVTAQAKPF